MRFRLGACEVVKKCVVGSTERERLRSLVPSVFPFSSFGLGWDRSKFRGLVYVLSDSNLFTTGEHMIS